MTGTSIGDFALLSDCHTAALVDRTGSVDWYCPERFDSPAVFARMLGEAGGHWCMRPAGEFETERAYLKDTMVLRTEFRTPGGRVVLTDALAFGDGERGHEVGLRSPHVLLRRVEGLEGEVEMELEFAPRPEYALTEPLLLATGAGTVVRGVPIELHLTSGRPLNIGETEARARFTIRPGETADFVLSYRRAVGHDRNGAPHLDVGDELQNTVEGWRSFGIAQGV